MGADLVDLGDGVMAWVHDVTDPFSSNVGVVVDDDGTTLIDSGSRPDSYLPLAESLARLGLVVTTIVLTHEHPDHVAGAGAGVFRPTRIVAAAATARALAEPPMTEVLQRLHPSVADQIAGLAHPVPTDAVTRPTRLGRLSIDLLGGHTDGDLVVHVDDADVVFTGDLCVAGTVAIGLGADVDRWSTSLATPRAASARRVVPGHGPVGGPADLRAVEDYLAAVVDAAARGAPTVAAGPWDAWHDVWAERIPDATHRINVERAREPEALPDALLALLSA